MISVGEKKKMGRPYSNGAEKSITKRARMTEEDVAKLKYCCKRLGKKESEVMRLGIDEIYKTLKSKQGVSATDWRVQKNEKY